jgi:hypothetical protein
MKHRNTAEHITKKHNYHEMLAQAIDKAHWLGNTPDEQDDVASVAKEAGLSLLYQKY